MASGETRHSPYKRRGHPLVDEPGPIKDLQILRKLSFALFPGMQARPLSNSILPSKSKTSGIKNLRDVTNNFILCYSDPDKVSQS
jgi:hypothetical protein